MQEKRTLYLAGKITGDPYYFTKFYNAQKKLEEGGFIVVNPALLPAEGFTWEAYMRMSGAMLAECAEVCFLPDWKESKGAKYEFGEAMAQNKPFSSSLIGRGRRKKRVNTNARQKKPTRSLFNASHAEKSTSFRQHTQMGTLANIAAAD